MKKLSRISLDAYFEKAGFSFTVKALTKRLLIWAMSCSLLTSVVWLVIEKPTDLLLSIGFFIVSLVILFFGFALLFSLVVFVYTDLTIDTRRTLIERFFPDYLHLVAANVRSGMSLDHALWGAVRPQFGVLSKEIELVSKKTMIGHPLDEALIEFSKKYDSQIVIRSISLIVEGIGAGSEIGDLLENIALNIEDITIRKQSMAANVTTYVIFVGFAVTVAAPLLFAIAIQLLRILHTIGEKVSISSSGTAFSLSTTAVGQGDFLFFCIANITCTAILASFIVSAIQSGRWTDAVKKIPVFLSVPLILFFVAQWILAYVFAGLI